MAVSGFNGANETQIGSSGSVGFDIYDDNYNKINVSNSINPIDIWINKTQPINFKFSAAINTSNLNSSSSQFIQLRINFTTKSASIHVHIKPDDPNLGYYVLFKFNGSPTLSSIDMNFDYLKIMCPNSSKIFFNIQDFTQNE